MPNTYDVSGPTPPRRLAIFGNVGTQNLGDEATLAAVLRSMVGTEVLQRARNTL